MYLQNSNISLNRGDVYISLLLTVHEIVGQRWAWILWILYVVVARRIGNLFYCISNIFIGLGCCTRIITWTICVRFYLVILIRDFYDNYKNVPDKNQLCLTCLHYKETQNVFYLNRKFNGPFFAWKLHCKWRLSVSYLFFCFLFSLFLKVMNYKFQGIDPG